MCWRSQRRTGSWFPPRVSFTHGSPGLWILVWLSRQCLGFPQALGPVKANARARGGLSPGRGQVPSSDVSLHFEFSSSVVHWASQWTSWIGSCAVSPNTSFCFLFGFSHHLENSTLRFNGPSGKSWSSWENVKSLRFPEGTRGEG